MMTCPSCGHDDQVQKVSAIHANGTRHGTAMVGWDVASVRSQSDLARRLAPPRKREWHWIVWGFLILVTIEGLGVSGLGNGATGFGLGMAAIGGIPLLLHLTSDARRHREYAMRLAQWRQSWYCHRCDTTFTGGDGTK